MDRITRSKLKTDRFAVEVEHSVEYVAEHRKQVMMYGAIAVAVACIIAGIWYYRDRQAAARQAGTGAGDGHHSGAGRGRGCARSVVLYVRVAEVGRSRESVQGH